MMLVATRYLALQSLDMGLAFLSESFLASSVPNAFLLGRGQLV